MIDITQSRYRKHLRRAVAALLLVLGAGCSAPADPTPPPQSTETTPAPMSSPAAPTSATPTLGEEETAAAQAALSVYEAATALDLQAYSDPAQDWDAEYRLVIGDPYLQTKLLSLASYRENGLAFRGRPSSDPQVDVVQLVPFGQVTIRDCYGVGDWVAVDVETGELSGEQPEGEYPIVSLVTRYDDGRWLVSEKIPYPAESC